MADKKKLTTAEILALARKQGAGGASSADKPADDEGSPQKEAAEAPSEDAGGTPSEAPKTTADILAAARAQGGKASKPKADDKGSEPAKPSSTADILAAARAQGGKKSAAVDKPKSTADILAAARAQGGKSSAAKPAAKADAPAKAAAKPAVAATSGDKPALKDMVAVVKSQQDGIPPKLPVKPVPAKPKLPAKKEVSRRRFVEMLSALAISPFVLAWIAMSGIGTMWLLGIARFMMPNMVLELPSQFKVGPLSDFPGGTVSEKFKASRGVWIVNTDQYNGQSIVYALLSICTHLGCTPSWLEGEQKFKCPCHGSGFYITGVNFEGPAPRPLERVGIRIAPDGALEVDKSLKFQEELGQWADTKSFVEVG